MMANLKVLTVSLLAILTVGAANAEIASKAYVERIVGGINIPTVPTKTSQLTNDSGYITSAALPTVDSALSTTSEKAVQNKVVTAALNNKVGSVTEGSANGTISVDGTDVAVHGLGDMAYKAWGSVTNYADSVANTAKTDAVYTAYGQMMGEVGPRFAKKQDTLVTDGDKKNITGAGSVTVSKDSETGLITITGAPTDITGKADKAYIQAGTATKITYNSQGIVTAGTTLSASDIPTIEQSQVNGLATALAGKQAAITSSAKLGADLVDDTTATHKFVTAEEKATWNAKQNAIPANTYDAYGAATTAAGAVETKLGAGANGYDINAKSLKVNGTNVLTAHQDISGKADTSTVNAELAKKVNIAQTATNAKKVMSTDSTGNVVASSITGGGSVTVTVADSGAITVSGTDNNTTYSTGNTTTSGLTKLYTSTGNATDGTITQAALTTALANARNQVPSGSENNAAASATIWVE